MILSVSIPASQESHLAVELLQHGLSLTAEVVDRSDDTVFVDVVGDPYKTLRASLRAGATPLAYVGKVPRTRD
jgi:hypothetical protein